MISARMSTAHRKKYFLKTACRAAKPAWVSRSGLGHVDAALGARAGVSWIGPTATAIVDCRVSCVSVCLLWSPAAAVVVRFEKNTALSRGWCMPLARGSAVCEQNASHNTQILACFPHQLDGAPFLKTQSSAIK